jgi:hypothetical protein
LNYRKGKFLLDVIILFLLDESRNKLENQGIDSSPNSYKKPLFNFVNFCMDLNLNTIKELGIIKCGLFMTKLFIFY